MLGADCNRTLLINETLRYAGFKATHSGHSSHSPKVIHIALGMNDLVNGRCGCVERRIVLLLLYTRCGSVTRLHDVGLGGPRVLQYYIPCMRFIVRRSSLVGNLLSR